VQLDRQRPRDGRALFQRRGIRPGAARPRRDLRGGGGVPRAAAGPPQHHSGHRFGAGGAAPGARHAGLPEPGRGSGVRGAEHHHGVPRRPHPRPAPRGAARRALRRRRRGGARPQGDAAREPERLGRLRGAGGGRAGAGTAVVLRRDGRV
ncbi:MAG: PTPS-like type 4, partial [uncultured Acetobacteraceae bacterium]